MPTLLLVLLLVVVAAIITTTTAPAAPAVVELVAAKLLVSAIIIAHIASGLGALYFDRLSENLKWLAERCVNCSVTVEGHEAEASRTACLLVHHKGGVDDTTELLEEFGEVFLSGFLADTADKDLAGPFLLFPGNRTLGIDLLFD